MSAPLDFLKIFSGQLRQAGIPFAITSGMACVHYGLQQITKDSDWIIPAGALQEVRDLFARLEGELPPWRISYRQICGAPLDADFMTHGWTSHLSVWDSAGSVEHKVDIFSKPPRVQLQEITSDAEGWASRHVVAQMKRTDRDKDWPIVKGLGVQLRERHQVEALLHLMDLESLLGAWQTTRPEAREAMAVRRPLLRLLNSQEPKDSASFERWFLLERLIWERVNQQRHALYTRPWRRFYRDWRQEPDWDWVTSEPFGLQHQRLVAAARKHGLPENPLAGSSAETLLSAAAKEVRLIAAATEAEIAKVLPPVYELLP